MTEVRGERNEFSGEVHGPVVQAGTVGAIHLDSSRDKIEFLSAAGILPRLARISADQAAIGLATLEPGKAADVISMMPEARRIEIVACMDAASATAIVKLLPEETAVPLRLAGRAARSISSDAAGWHDLLGDASGGLSRQGRSRRGTTGFAIRYERGTVYWSKRTGTGMVAGAVEKRHGELGGLSGRLGYPIGRETQAATSRFGTSGTFQRFESTWDYSPKALEKTDTVCGATIYASDKGVFSTRGGIGQYYEAGGGTWGPLGFPLSEERPVPGPEGDTAERYRQEFEGGAVYWSEATGVVSVRPPIREIYERDLLKYGLPLEEQESEESDSTTWGQLFESGAIVYEARGRVAEVLGEIYEHWHAHMDELGLPESSERMLGDGPDLVQFFEDGVVTVVDGVVRRWLLADGD